MTTKPTPNRLAGSRQDRTPVLHFRLSRTMHTALKVRAAREGRPMSRVVVDALAAYLDESERREGTS